MPVFGQGTWHMGERAAARSHEVRALQRGLELGLTLVDTAEMYAQGGAEEVVAEAIAGRRDQVFLVSKVYPYNASCSAMVKACEASLRRLKVETLDLYLLHWPGSVPLAETVEAFEGLKAAGKINDFGVSNFDTSDLEALVGLDGGLTGSNQILYNLARRGPEAGVIPHCRQRGIPVMAYSPIDQTRLLRHGGLQDFAAARGVSAAQVALAWLLHQPDVVVIPKSARVEGVEENRRALDMPLSPDDLAELDGLFPPPTGPTPLEIL
ncbi:MAG: aldo/keto reductase [Candidatus Competibacterales bacterium]